MQIPGYRDLTVLGRGGFSTVYRALQESVQRDVALKVLGVHMAGADAKARFRRECATNGRVGTHPNIVTLFDSGFADDGSPYLAMQLCGGGSLSERLRATGPLPVAEALRIGVKISAALQYAHSAGVLHRDIKPENILISDFGEPELADFGISSVEDQRLSTVTASSFTINHAAPETLAGQPSSVSSDVYSLCSTLFTLVAGRTPFNAPSAAALVALVNLVMNTPAPATDRADVPASLERLLAAGLSKTPAGRPGDAKAVGSALQDIQRQLGLPVTEFPSAPPPLAFSPTQTLSAKSDGSNGDRIDTGALPGTGAMPPTGRWGDWASNAIAGGPAAGPAAGGPAAGPWSPPPGDVRGRLGPPPVLPSPSRLAASSIPDEPRSDRRGWIWAAVAATVVVLAVVVYLIVAHPGSGERADPGGVTGPSTTASSTAANSRKVATSPATPTTRVTPTTRSSVPAPAAGAEISSFASPAHPNKVVSCSSSDAVVQVPLTWTVTNATNVWVAVDVKTGDASQQPFASDLPAVVGPGRNPSTFDVPFSCSQSEHDVSLTVLGSAGKVTSRLRLVARPAATTSATPSTTSTTPTSSASTPTTPTTSTSGTPTSSTPPTPPPSTPPTAGSG